MTAPALREQKAPDIRLIVKVMEEKIIRGESMEQCRRILERQNLWRGLTPYLQLTWARLAQMSGAVETALAVLDHLNRAHPEMEAAWSERIEMLSVLENKEETARTRRLFEELTGKNPPSPEGPGLSPEPDIEAAAAPFRAARNRSDDITLFLNLFSGRQECFARQWADKENNKQGYTPVRRQMTQADVEAHVSGKQTLGIYLLRSDETVKTAVLDVDLRKSLRGGSLSAHERQHIRKEQIYLFSRVNELSNACGIQPLAEFSGGKGYHFWFFFENPVAAGRAKHLLDAIAAKIAGDLSSFHIEVFPKQARLSGKGLGNLVKLPVGVHRLSGRRSHFTGCKDRSSHDQLQFLKTVRPVRFDSLNMEAVSPAGEVVVLPAVRRKTGGSNKKRPVATAPPPEDERLAILAARCPPMERAMSSCMNGKGLFLAEEKVLYQTLGFLPDGRAVIHQLMKHLSGYNSELVDFKLSHLSGTILGCRRIHALMGFEGPICRFGNAGGYPHPLKHLPENIQNTPMSRGTMQEALEGLKAAVKQMETALNPPMGRM